MRRDVPAVSFEVEGDDRERVGGIADELTRILNRGRSRVPGLLWLYSVPAGLPLVIVLALAARVLAESREAARPFIFAVLATWVVVIAAAWWLAPPLELIVPGQRTRLERFRAFIVTGVVAIAFGLVSTALYGLVWAEDDDRDDSGAAMDARAIRGEEPE